jgi:hypothetical protein
MKTLPALVRHAIVGKQAGSWQLFATPAHGKKVALVSFRGIPTQLGSMSFEDPYGPSAFSFTLPQATIFDRRGIGDLEWAVKNTDVDLVWTGPLPAGYPWPSFRWEGYIVDFGFSDAGMEITCTGALHQLDGTLAKPEFPARPLPYEWAIARCFLGDPSLRVGALQMHWPSWWKIRYADPAKGTPTYLIPTGVKSGDNWTAMLTRSTGSWDAMLTGYIQSLLSSMYTERGRFALDLWPGRVPVLLHRDLRFAPDDDVPVVDLVAPGVTHTLNEDHTQSSTTLFGQGTSLSGIGYSGMEVSADGQSTIYLPLASTRQTYPASDSAGWYDRTKMRQEVLLQLQQGLDEDQARKVAIAHQQRFGDPGLTGTITLATDPLMPDGTVIPRHLVRAGMDIQLPRVFGSADGVVAHISSSDANIFGGTVDLTVDTKCRDALTVDEVRIRGRDALTVTRMLVAGGYSPPIPDQLLPWNYATGSGCIPSGPQLSSQRLWSGMPNSIHFPWTDWTITRPPKAAAWKTCYIHLGPAAGNADKNWAQLGDIDGSFIAIPIKAAQAATIRLLQLAAYDKDGHVLPVDFHIGFYLSRGANFMSTPFLPAAYATAYPPYTTGQHYPFFPGAWEHYNADGTATQPELANATDTSGLIRAYGSNYEKAGHWPGSFAAGDPATGMLVDEATWEIDTTHFDANFDPYSPTRNATNPLAGMIYCLIYCDAQKSQDVYFAGRLFRAEPGTTT